MNKNTVICGIEHALRNDGCNEIPVGELYARVRKTRGNFDVSLKDFMTVLRELERDGLFESFGDTPEISEGSLIARSQTHPSVPYGDGRPPFTLVAGPGKFERSSHAPCPFTAAVAQFYRSASS